MNLTIKTQFLILFGSVLCINLASASLTVFQLTKINTEVTNLADNWLPSIKATGSLATAIEHTRTKEARLVMSDETQIPESLKQLTEARQGTDGIYADFAPTLTSDKDGYQENLQNLEDFNGFWQKYQ